MASCQIHSGVGVGVWGTSLWSEGEVGLLVDTDELLRRRHGMSWDVMGWDGMGRDGIHLYCHCTSTTKHNLVSNPKVPNSAKVQETAVQCIRV